MTNPVEFDHPYITVDVLIFCIKDHQLNTLLIKRSHPPFADMFAIPGGFVALGESLDQAAIRVLSQKGHLNQIFLEQLYSFGDVNRDPRGRVISVSYYALVPQDKVTEFHDKKHTIKWCPVKKLPPLAFDHKQIISTALDRIKAKIAYSSIAIGLLPKKFRLSQLQTVYEIILNKLIDKRNFRKKMASVDLLEPVGEIDNTGSHRPAALYRFKAKTPVIFD